MQRFITGRRTRTVLAACAAAGVLVAPAAVRSQSTPAKERPQAMPAKDMKVSRGAVDRTLAAWPEKPREVARMMMEKYGPPNGATPSRLIWRDNGPWKETIVYRDVVQHDFPMPHPDLLEQFIDYQVPPDKFDELAQYDGSVIAERTKGVISARCDKEEANFLALNLAHDVVTGKKSVEEARAFYAESIKALMAGQKPAYTQKLQFEVPKGRTEDPDKPAAGMAAQ